MSVLQTHERSATAGVARRWFVVRTRARQEKAVARTFTALCLEHFLPLVRRVRYHGRRKATAMVPLFPGYLFLLADLERAYEVDRSERVAQILPVHDQRQFLDEIAQIRAALERGALLQSHPWVARGVRVEVVSGPFRGVRGVIESRARNDRLILRLEVIGSAAALEIDSALLSPVPDD